MNEEKKFVTIHAVHDRDVKKMWNKLRLPAKKNCFSCGKEVTAENVGAFMPVKGEVEVVCENPICLVQAYERRRLKESE